jgi:hypothetical protein
MPGRSDGMTDICPEIILRAAAPKDEDFSPSIAGLLDSPNTANLKRIVCNVLEPVLLRLLVCKDEKSAGTPDTRPYPEHKKLRAVKSACDETRVKLAQMYIRHDKIKPKARSCLIVFIKGCYLSETDELLEMLQNSVTWLDVAQEKPYFYIFCYGLPMFQNAFGDLCKKIDRRLKEVFPGYSQEENVCIPAQVSRDSEVLFINSSGTRFSLRAG